MRVLPARRCSAPRHRRLRLSQATPQNFGANRGWARSSAQTARMRRPMARSVILSTCARIDAARRAFAGAPPRLRAAARRPRAASGIESSATISARESRGRRPSCVPTGARRFMTPRRPLPRRTLDHRADLSISRDRHLRTTTCELFPGLSASTTRRSDAVLGILNRTICQEVEGA